MSNSSGGYSNRYQQRGRSRGRGNQSSGRQRGRGRGRGQSRRGDYQNRGGGGYQQRGRGRGGGRGGYQQRGRGRGQSRGRGGYQQRGRGLDRDRGRGQFRGRGRGGSYQNRGRGGSRGRGRGNNYGGYQNGGGYQNRGGYRGGRGGYRGRGRGRGRGFGRGRGRGRSDFHGVAPSDRFSEAANNSLMDNVYEFNSSDYPGPQQVKWSYYDNKWRKIQSLSEGKSYYLSPNGKTLNFGEIPAECKGKSPCDVSYHDQGSKFCKPPLPQCWNNKLPIIPNIHTNAYVIKGGIFNNVVNIFDVTFDPPINSINIQQSINTVLGVNWSDKKRNRQLLNDKFGYWAFDNNQMFSIGKKASKSKPINDIKLSSKHSVIFTWKAAQYLDSDEIPITEEEQLLNIFNKKCLRTARFNEVDRGWYYKDATNPPHYAMKKLIINQKVSVMIGYRCSIHILPSVNGERRGIFKADLKTKLISTSTVHEHIHYNILPSFGNKINDPSFKKEIQNQLIGKYFVMSYNSMSNKIQDVTLKENEQTTFELRNGTQISYKQYLINNYSISVPKKEICIIKDRKNNGYLPQLANLTLRSDEIADVYTEVLDKTNQPVQTRFECVHALIQTINKSENIAAKDRTKKLNQSTLNNDDAKDEEKQQNIQLGMHINSKQIITDAVKLEYPLISIQTRNGPQSTPITELSWGRQTSGFLGQIKYVKNWCIVSEHNYLSNAIYNKWQNYARKRGFDYNNPPLGEPKSITVNLQDPGEWHAAIYQTNNKNNNLDAIMLIVPEGAVGSKIKVMFTKMFQQKRLIGSKNNRRGIVIQSIQASQVNNTSGVFGAFEDLMAKCGNILFKINPKIRANSLYNCNKIWTVGIDVSHVKGKPSVAMLVLQTLPWHGTLRGMRKICHLNKPRTEIIPFAAMVTMVYKALNSVINKKTILPETILVFRDGLPDNSLKECYSKEVVGIKRGINIMINELKRKQKRDWKVKIQFIVVSKSPIEKFGQFDNYNKKTYPIEEPACVYRGITNGKIWDFFMWNFHPSKRNKINTIKPLRYVVLRDELKLGQKKKRFQKNDPLNLFQIIYSLSYTYVFSIPFPLGGTSQPAPIMYASHYAESYSQIITNKDTNLIGLQFAKNLVSKAQIITNLKPLADMPNLINKKKKTKNVGTQNDTN